jgi:hypothetical protein
MGWRTATTFLPIAFSICTTLRLVWLLPQPVRLAHTATMGLVDAIMVRAGLSSWKSAPAALHRLARFITRSWETSL